MNKAQRGPPTDDCYSSLTHMVLVYRYSFREDNKSNHVTKRATTSFMPPWNLHAHDSRDKDGLSWWVQRICVTMCAAPTNILRG